MVAVGDTFDMMGWVWTVTEVVRGQKSFWAEVPGKVRARKFSAEHGEAYYGEPDPEPAEDE